MEMSDENWHRLWYCEYYAKSVIPESGAFSFNYLTILVEFECAPKRMQILQYRYAKADGTLLKTEPSEDVSFKTPVPDSIQELVIDRACKMIDSQKASAQEDEETMLLIEEKTGAIPAGDVGKKAASNLHLPPAPVVWRYGRDNGPNKWGGLSAENILCATG